MERKPRTRTVHIHPETGQTLDGTRSQVIGQSNVLSNSFGWLRTVINFMQRNATHILVDTCIFHKTIRLTTAYNWFSICKHEISRHQRLTDKLFDFIQVSPFV